ncbi:MAG: alpha/beta hydrolase [Fuerstiella sp.]|nr:alpha/beta hydrolase [Fuerstiella sp.]
MSPSPQTRRTLFMVFLVLTCLSVADVSAETPKAVTTADPISQACLRPMKGDFRRPDEVGLTASEVHFANAGGHRLRAWFFPVKNARQSVLFCMGNTGNISLMLPYAKILQQGGFDVLLFDYQGFGESEGVPSVGALLGDCLVAFDFLQTHTQRAPEDIGVFGVSLGSFLALTVAAEKNVGAVAVEDAFIPDETLDRFSAHVTGDSAVAQMTLQGIKFFLLKRVDPLHNVTRLQCPVFFLHGERDRLLRPSGTLRIAANATVPKRIWLIPNTGHAPQSLETNDREYAGQLTTFFPRPLLVLWRNRKLN